MPPTNPPPTTPTAVPPEWSGVIDKLTAAVVELTKELADMKKEVRRVAQELDKQNGR